MESLKFADQGYQLIGSSFCLSSIASDIGGIGEQYQQMASLKNPVASLRFGTLVYILTFLNYVHLAIYLF